MSRLIASLFAAAFLSSLMPLAAYEAHTFGLCFGLMILALILGLKNPVIVPRSGVLGVAAAFWALAGLSSALSAVPFISLIYFCFFSVMPLGFLLTLIVPDKRMLFQTAAGGVAVIFAALSVYSLLQYFFMPEMLFSGRVHWPLADPNALAALFSLAFFASVGWMFAAPSRVQSNVALGFSVLFLAGFFTTGSRGALLAMLAGLGLFFILNPTHVRKHKHCSFILAGAGILLLAVLYFAASERSTPLVFVVAESVTGQMSLLWDRPAIWASTWAMIKDHFWIGTGIGTFFLYYPQYRTEGRTAGFMAHSDPLQFWAEIGVLAPLLFYGFIILAVMRTRKALKNLAVGDERRIYILAPFCALAAMILQTHITFNFYVLPVLMLTGVMLGFWFENTQTEVKIIRFHPAFTIVPALGVLLFFGMLQGSYILTERAAVKMAAGDFNGFTADVNDADRLSQHLNHRAYTLGAAIPLGILESQEGLPPPEREKLYLQIEGILQKAEALNPRDATVFYYKARAELAMGRKPETEALLKHALRIDPLHWGSRIALADLFVAQGDKAQALAVMKEGMRWRYHDRDAAAYYEKLAWLALDMNDKALHSEAMVQMLRIKKREMDAMPLKAIP